MDASGRLLPEYKSGESQVRYSSFSNTYLGFIKSVLKC